MASEGAAGRANRRAFLRALPQSAVALTAACAFGSARTSQQAPAEGVPPAGSVSEPLMADAWESADAQVAQAHQGAPRRAQPLPMEENRAWLQEWLDLAGLHGKTVTTGC